MSVLIAIAITTGILSGVWGWVATTLGLLSWAGFLGCTTYFASPKDGVKGLALSMATNLSGVFWAMVIIKFSDMINLEIMGYVITAVVAFVMCAQAKLNWLSFIPGTFIGSCATFAANGDWALVIPSLLVGVLFGYCMKSSGIWLREKLTPSDTLPVTNPAAE
ncbi:hypothetical protein A3K86_15800 [Photobacterium jeanii]|uniref:Glutathione-regulated potassium-efflux system protein n=1 Tax=Photobacterium jeanii TaxID=858640 RepID=A0A178K7S9_9GAMM|nr:DUF1097 domain-containing protein [Photobacterium jeanii]OAN13126.1 hypothetical protein A3K86_15800 [Photobacterium jeanii]PST89277.1 DUF1097 domain-containing protein [Photobacterium jeanii]